MTADDLHAIVKAAARLRPFRNFEIEFGSGDRLLVGHPEAVARRGNLFQYQGPASRSTQQFHPTSRNAVTIPGRRLSTE